MSSSAAQVRRCQRIGLDFDNAIPVEGWGTWRKSFRGWVTVLGVGGAFLEVNDSSIVGSVVELRFMLPGTENEITCGGVVRDRVPGRGMGIEFTRLASSDRELIAVTVMRSILRRSDGDGEDTGENADYSAQ